MLYPTVEDEWEQADDLKPMTKEKIQERMQKMIRKTKLKHRKSEARKNSESDLDLNERMSAGPLKKKAKRG